MKPTEKDWNNWAEKNYDGQTEREFAIQFAEFWYKEQIAKLPSAEGIEDEAQGRYPVNETTGDLYKSSKAAFLFGAKWILRRVGNNG